MATDDELRHVARQAKAAIPKPYDTDVLQRDQDVNLWIDYHVAADTAALRAVAEQAYDEGANRAAGGIGWAKGRNPYRARVETSE